jgi:hypothetical protein
MNESPDDQDNPITESEDSARSHDIGEQFAEGEKIGGLFQLYKQVKLLLLGDPASHNASKDKTQQLNSLINDPNAKEQPSHDPINLKSEEFSESILRIWNNKRERQDKQSNIYDINNPKKPKSPKL